MQQTLDNTFVWADQHQHHTNIIKYCNRPFPSVEAMNEALFAAVKELPPDSYLYDLGDFSFGTIDKIQESWEKYCQILENKNIELIPFAGNHCNLKKVFDKEGGVSNYDYYYHLEDYLEIKVEGKYFVLCHYPLESWNGKEKGSFHLCGHVHRHMLTDWGSNRLQVSVDCTDFRPISLRATIEKIQERNKDNGWQLRLAKKLQNHHIGRAEEMTRNNVLAEMLDDAISHD